MINPWPGEAPVYAQLADTLRRQIRSGELAPGQALPSERRLHEETGLGRHTIRRAVAVLRTEGLVTFVKGTGMVVRDEPELQVLSPPAGATVTARMPTGAERAEFGLDEGVPVFVVVTAGSEHLYPADRWMLRMP